MGGGGEMAVLVARLGREGGVGLVSGLGVAQILGMVVARRILAIHSAAHILAVIAARLTF